ncbi:SDR family oxidoreductase [Ruegeria sp. 6PALISEP08]|uniref:SDR family oxidoreductase n=1 Tax=Ruegeria sp. 6PALISEP08 TaxID=1225660 RepID=UPI00067E6568|nr:SDR family oxidoreductase [Ruegeria sp. 6PALISEP08]
MTAGLFESCSIANLIGLSFSDSAVPGWIDTELNIDFIQSIDDPDAFRRAIDRIHPVSRTGAPDEVAALFAFLASDEAGFITGQVYTVDGGRMTQFSLP